MPSKAFKLAESIVSNPVMNDIVTNTAAVPATITTQIATSTDQGVATVTDLPNTGNNPGDIQLVEATNRLYVWNGSGWYNIALINTTPTWDSGGQPSGSYVLDADSPQDATVITLAASDPEGLPISYSYVTGGSMDSMATISQDSSVFTITPKTVAQVGEGAELTGSITFRASDGINILPSVSSFTLNFTTVIENSKYTTLLVTATDTSDNNNIIDSSTNNQTITVTSDAHAGTFSPYRHGGYSTYFDGTGDVIYTPQDTAFNFGTADFTFEAWVYPTLYTSNNWNTLFSVGDTTNTGGLLIGKTDTGSFVIRQYGTANIVSTTTLPDLNTWTHIACVRSSGTSKIYYNGSEIATASDTTNYSSTTPFAHIGNSDHTTYSHYWNGYVFDARVVSGTAVYTGNFTPPTERLTAITNTQLLTCHLPYMADGSSNAHSITVNGDTSVKPFTPFDNLEYEVADNGGSIYFDGIDDLLTITADPALDFGTGDFTIEAWVYNTGTDYFNIWQNAPVLTTTDTSRAFFGIQGNYGVNFGRHAGGGSIATSANAAPKNQWNHVVLVRDSTSVRIYVNGVEGVSTTDTALTNYGFGQHTITVGYRITPNYGQGYISDLKTVKGTALYTANFTPPTAPLTATSGTGLLLSGTDASIIDKSQSSNIVLANTAVGSTDQFKFANTKSLKFYGSSNYARAKDVPALRTGDFTYEGWIYTVSGQAGTANTFFDTRSVPTSSADGFYIMHRTDNSNKFRVGTDGTVFLNSTNSYDLDTWHHWALVRSGTTCTFYINGVADATTFTSSMDITSQDVTLGASMAGTGNTWVYLQDVRISSYARYTANFTPPTAPLEG